MEVQQKQIEKEGPKQQENYKPYKIPDFRLIRLLPHAIHYVMLALYAILLPLYVIKFIEEKHYTPAFIFGTIGIMIFTGAALYMVYNLLVKAINTTKNRFYKKGFDDANKEFEDLRASLNDFKTFLDELNMNNYYPEILKRFAKHPTAWKRFIQSGDPPQNSEHNDLWCMLIGELICIYLDRLAQIRGLT